MSKRSITPEESAAYQARLAKWMPCLVCHFVCEVLWIFWCCGIIPAVTWFFMNGWWKSGGWTLAIGLIGAYSFKCNEYILPPNVPEPDDD